jgi:hypothetical protein
MRPWPLAARNTLWPNSTGFCALPRLMRSVGGPKSEKIFASFGTLSPSRTRRRACSRTRAVRSQYTVISARRAARWAAASGSAHGMLSADYAFVETPHPIANLTDAELDERPEALVKPVLALLS